MTWVWFGTKQRKENTACFCLPRCDISSVLNKRCLWLIPIRELKVQPSCYVCQPDSFLVAVFPMARMRIWVCQCPHTKVEFSAHHIGLEIDTMRGENSCTISFLTILVKHRNRWWMPCPWRCPRSGWIGLCALMELKVSLFTAGVWTRWPLRVPFHSNDSVMWWLPVGEEETPSTAWAVWPCQCRNVSQLSGVYAPLCSW